MKVLRSTFVFLCGLILFLSCMLLYISGMTQELFSSDISSILVENIDITKPFDKVLSEIPNGYLLQPYVDKQVEDVKKTLLQNEDFTAFVNTYSLEVLHSLADDHAAAPDINKDIQKVIEKHENELKNSLGNSITDAQKDILIKGMKDNINLSKTYTDILNYAKDRLSPQQVEIIKFINIFTKPFTKTLSYILMTVSILLIIIIKRSFYSWLLPVGLSLFSAGGILFVGSIVADKLLSGTSSVVMQFINTESQRMGIFAYWYIGIGVIACILHMGCSLLVKQHS